MTLGAQAARMGAGVLILAYTFPKYLEDSPSSVETREGVVLQPRNL